MRKEKNSGLALCSSLTLGLLIPNLSFFENTVDPDQLASNEAI